MRVQVLLSDKMVKRLDRVCDELGISRSSFSAILIMEGIFSFEKQLNIDTEKE